jgi:hypothetical protein
MGTLDAASLLPLCSLEEKLDAGLKLRIETAQFAMHHGDYLVVVLQTQ